MIHAASVSGIMHRFRDPQSCARPRAVWRNSKSQIRRSRKNKRAGFRQPFVFVVRPERFELPTPWFVAKYSIQMSYGRLRGPDYTEETGEDKIGKHAAAGLPTLRIISSVLH